MQAPLAPVVPREIRTPRLLLRPWTRADADALGPVLAADAARLAPWLPARVAAPAPTAELRERLAGYEADFAAGRAFRYAVLLLAAGEGDAEDAAVAEAAPAVGALLGGADLHPRTAAARVPLAEADRVELGYWLAAGAEGRGYVTEASRALLDVAAALPGLANVEARVDPRNARSVAVSRRLGFARAGADGAVDVWSMPLRR